MASSSNSKLPMTRKDSNDKGLQPTGVTFPLPAIIFSSIASSVTLILVNKTVMRSYGFDFVFSLTTFHFICTWLALSAVSVAGGFEAKKVDSMEALKVAVMGVGSIAFMNFSLQTNTVGTYQMMKLLVVPCVMLIQKFVFGVTYSTKVKLSLLLLLVGVGVATVTDVGLQPVGLLFGTLSVLATAQFQIWQGSKQKELGTTSVQLTHILAPFQALICGAAALTLERDIIAHPFSASEVILILVSGGTAVSVNLCSMGLIGKTSPIVYQVVGHAKTCLILLGGYLLMPVSPSAGQLFKNLLGVAIALAGVFWFSYLKVTAEK